MTSARRPTQHLIPAALAAASFAACRIGFDAVPGADSDATGTRTITVTIEGDGAVTSTPPGLGCYRTCSATFDAPPVLHAHALDGWELSSWTTGCTEPTCALGEADREVTVQFVRTPIVANRMFVTRQHFTGNLGGRSGADARCQTAADVAQLGGMWRAFLGTTTELAATALAGSRGWVRVDGVPVFDTVAELAMGPLRHPILHDEYGIANTTVRAWTGLAPGGGTDPDNCSDWSTTAAVVGRVGTQGQLGDDAFSDTVTSVCTGMHPIYCIEIGKVATIPPIASVPIGRFIFVTEGTIPGNAGIAAADVECASEATAAGLPGSYLAMLATTTMSIRARFTDLAGPWRRADDVPIWSDDLAATQLLRTAINVTAAGTPAFVSLWTGADMTLTAPGNMTCGDWTTTVGTGYSGRSDNSEIVRLLGQNNGCGNSFAVLCAQQ